MANLTKNLNLVDDLVYALFISELGSFHGYDGTVFEISFENFAESAEPEEIGFGEIVGGFDDFFAGEDSIESGTVGTQ